MRGTIRGAAVILGAAAAVYGAASLTGEWLGTPPWWEREPTEDEARDVLARWAIEVGTRRDGAPAGPSLLGAALPATGSGDAVPPPPRLRVPRDGRNAISAAVTAAGLALVIVGTRPRRRLGAAP